MLLQSPGAQYRAMIDSLSESNLAGVIQKVEPQSQPVSPAKSKHIQQSRDGDSFEPSKALRSSLAVSETNSANPARVQEAKAHSKEAQSATKKSDFELNEDEEAEVESLKERDQEVRLHEQAHASAAGAYSRGISLEYTTGPDQQRYATSGSVAVDMSPINGDPQATIQKAQTLQRAASAPDEPSSKDKSVQSQAQSMESQAREELSDENEQKISEDLEKTQIEGTTSAVSSSNPYKNASQSYSSFEANMSSMLNLVA